jgi:anti-sigma factor RsiW
VTPNELSECADVVELVSACLDGELAAPVADAVRAHLALCPGCTTYFAQVRSTVEQVRTLQADDVPASLRDDLMEAFRSEVLDRG